MAKDWWERHEGLDLWSIPHFLFGILVAIAALLSPMPLLEIFIATLLVSIAWELFEKMFLGVDESLKNQILDVVLGLVGFVLTLYLFDYYAPSADLLTMVGIVVLALYGLCNFLGWQAHRRRERGDSA